MTATSTPTLKNHELSSSGLVDSASVNSIADFISSKSHEKKVTSKNERNDFINIVMCHFIFYSVFCFSLVLHILIDLGLGTVLKKSLIRFIDILRNIVIKRNTKFA
tara:strand:+ start:345 stop:662 length:318 start_codon:yes stop_codon:yes gene_type:complete